MTERYVGDMSHQKSILMIIGQIEPQSGGAQRQCIKLSKQLINAGYQVKILANWIDRAIPRCMSIEGVDCERIWYPAIHWQRRKVFGLGFLSWFFMALAIRRLTHNFQILHVHQGLWPLFSAALAAPQRTPIICKLGNSGIKFDLALSKKGFWGFLRFFIINKKVTKFIWTSQAVKEDLVRMGLKGSKMTHIPNGVEIREDFDIKKEGKIKAIYVGRLTQTKNITFLLQAIEKIPERYRHQFSLQIIGDGYLKDDICKTIGVLSQNFDVEYIGVAGDIYSYLRNSNVTILPSKTEGLSNAVLEAMSAGCAPILSYEGGNKDLIDINQSLDKGFGEKNFIVGQNGIYVNINNSSSLIEALIYLWDNSDRLIDMRRASYRKIVNTYRMEKIAKSYMELYRSLPGK